MSIEENKAIVRCLVDEAQSKGNIAIVDELFAANFVDHSAVPTRKTLHGTHQGEFLGVPPTGKRVAIEVIDILRIVDGKITDHWDLIDQLGLLRQLGVIPPEAKK